MKKEVPDLNKAIATLLYDQYDCPDVFEDMDTEESLIDETILVLAYKNEDSHAMEKGLKMLVSGFMVASIDLLVSQFM